MISVTEIPLDAVGPSTKRYADPLVPEVAWRVQVRLEDGRAVTVTETGERRYEPGQRVRVVLSENDALLL